METLPKSDQLIKNRVAESGLISLDPEIFRPKSKILSYDLRQNLFMDQIIREKDFRISMADHPWDTYQNSSVAVFCSTEAIIPLWAYMLLAGFLESKADLVFSGTIQALESYLWTKEIQGIDFEKYRDKRVVVKGCGDRPIPDSVYMDLSVKLKPIVKSLMFGEPCSTVPLFKN